MDEREKSASILVAVHRTAFIAENSVMDESRPLVRSVCQKSNFLISQSKHMFWVLKRTISIRRFF